MEDKKPCDDIFEGLADLLINNGEVTSNHYTRDRHGIMGIHLHTKESWSVNYGDYVYMIDTEDGETISIRRSRIESEDE